MNATHTAGSPEEISVASMPEKAKNTRSCCRVRSTSKNVNEVRHWKSAASMPEKASMPGFRTMVSGNDFSWASILILIYAHGQDEHRRMR